MEGVDCFGTGRCKAFKAWDWVRPLLEHEVGEAMGRARINVGNPSGCREVCKDGYCDRACEGCSVRVDIGEGNPAGFGPEAGPWNGARCGGDGGDERALVAGDGEGNGGEAGCGDEEAERGCSEAEGVEEDEGDGSGFSHAGWVL